MIKNCDLSKTNKVMIDTIKEDIHEIKNSLDTIKKSNNEMFNHFTTRYEEMFEKLRDRVPLWSTILITILGSILTGLAVFVIVN